MRDFLITTDSTSDLPKEFYVKHNVTYLPLSYILEGETYADMEGLTSQEFYNKLRTGAMPTTSQVNPEEAKEAFTKIVDKGFDVLHIGFSSALSGSYNSARIAAEQMMEEQSDVMIKTIDSRAASMGEGLLVYKAIQMKEAGKSLEEVSQWIEENKGKVCHYFTVDDLNHLSRGGRISKATAIVGTVVNIKPILHVNDEGKLISINKIRGRKKSIQALVDYMEEKIEGYEEINKDMIMISHGDCIEDANLLKSKITEKFGYTNIEINPVGPVIGSHSGPGTLALFFIGKEK